VPYCSHCNSAFSKDDEHFRDVLCLREELSDNPLVQQLNQSFLQRVDRPESQGYFNYLHNRMGEANIKTTSGIHLSKMPTYYEDLGRINCVLERITKGLYRYCLGNVLMDGFDAEAYPEEYYLSLNSEHRQIFENIFHKQLVNEEWFVVVPNGFSYKYYKLIKNPAYTLWQFLFYKKYFAFAITLKTEEKGNKNEPIKYRPFIMI
jgi:hypothetical protein